MTAERKKPELLAPAGDWEKLQMAVLYGADAVYLAGTSFGMRSFAGNFSDEELPRAVDFAHRHGVKVHATVNTMPRSGEVDRLPEHLEKLNDAGVDALILADLGAFTLAGKYAPRCQRHISTQQSIANYACAQAWFDLGAQRVVLARELSRRDIEEKLCDYLGCEKVIWLRDGIDPDETNGHIDDVACFVAPGEVACIWTEDPENPFYQAAQDAFRTLSQATDAKGRRLTVHKLCLTKKPCCLEGAETIDAVEGTVPRENGEVSIASYMNFLIVNGAVIAPQYGDENDQLAIQQLQQMFPDRQIVGVQTREVAFGGGNIHCITQQQPKA